LLRTVVLNSLIIMLHFDTKRNSVIDSNQLKVIGEILLLGFICIQFEDLIIRHNESITNINSAVDRRKTLEFVLSGVERLGILPIELSICVNYIKIIRIVYRSQSNGSGKHLIIYVRIALKE